MNIDQNLVCSFHILRAIRKMKWVMFILQLQLAQPSCYHTPIKAIIRQSIEIIFCVRLSRDGWVLATRSFWIRGWRPVASRRSLWARRRNGLGLDSLDFLFFLKFRLDFQRRRARILPTAQRPKLQSSTYRGGYRRAVEWWSKDRCSR